MFTRTLRSLLLASIALPTGFAAAQTLDCPSTGSTTIVTGTTGSYSNVSVPIDLLPCETVSVQLDLSSWPPAFPSLQFTLFDKNGASIDSEITSEGTTYIPGGWPWVPPMRGTRGYQGLPVTGELEVGYTFFGRPVNYTITVRKSPRHGYNLGGTGFDNAPMISAGDRYFGSLVPAEPGQFYKIHLEPNESIYLTGVAQGHQSFGSFFTIDLFDSSQQPVTNLVALAAYGIVGFPSSTTYVNNTGAAADYYLVVKTSYFPTHDFQFVVNTPLVMHLTLNAFLPYDNISDPHPISGHDRVFEGDGGGRSWDENGSSRTSQIMDIWNQYLHPATIFASGPFDWANITEQYQASTSLSTDGKLTDAARNDWVWDEPLKTSWGVPTNQADGCSGSQVDSLTVAVNCDLETPNGVYPAWLDPAITYQLSMTFGFTPTTTVNYSISGCRKYFPAYEIWAAHQLIYAGTDSGNPLHILVPCSLAIQIEQTGTITLQ